MYNKLKVKNIVLLVASCVVLFPAFSGGAAAGDNVAAMMTAATWTATGSQNFITSFPKAGGGARVVSKLQYPLNTQLYEFSLEAHISQQRFIRLGYANSNIRPGRGDDTDRDFSQGQAPWYYGTFQTKGGSQYYTIDIINKQKGFSTVAGYRAQTNFFRMLDGHYDIVDYLPVDHPLAGLNSTYKITYEGIWLGLQGKKSIKPGLTWEAGIFYSPYLRVKAAGNWNLRPLTFVQKGKGQGFEGNLALIYAPHRQLDVSVGYRYRWLKQAGGTDITYYDGDTYAANWDTAVSMQKGLVAKLNYRF